MMAEILYGLFGGMFVGLDGFLSALSLKEQLGDVVTKILSAITGVPFIVFSILFAVIGIIKVIRRFFF